MAPDSQIIVPWGGPCKSLGSLPKDRLTGGSTINVHFFNNQQYKGQEMTKKRGRKSSEELSLIHLATAWKPIEPPATLKAPEARIFREVVASCAVNHFRKADITAFATATHLSRFYADQIGETETAFKNWEAAVRLQISLATKLRITPQSRYDPKTIARNEPSDGPAPWEPTVAPD